MHAEHVLHANVAPTAAADDRVRVSEEVVAAIEAEHEEATHDAHFSVNTGFLLQLAALAADIRHRKHLVY